MQNVTYELYDRRGFGYSHRGVILINDFYEGLTGEEQIKITSDYITHEFMHHVLKCEIDPLVCRLFDLVEWNFVLYPGIEKKHLLLKSSETEITVTHKEYIEKYGLETWLSKVKHLTTTDINQAFILCNTRSDKEQIHSLYMKYYGNKKECDK